MKTKKYANGGPITPYPPDKNTIVNEANRKPIYTSNPNDPRLKAYQDSLGLYNRGEEKLKYWRNNPNATNVELNKKEGELDKKYPVSKDGAIFGANASKAISMEKIGSGSAVRSSPQYKKPVQPVEYKASEKTIVKPKDVSFSVKKKDFGPQKSLPKSINSIKYDASGINVYLTVNGKQSVMPKKEFTSWLKNSENKDMFDSYRKSSANKK